MDNIKEQRFLRKYNKNQERLLIWREKQHELRLNELKAYERKQKDLEREYYNGFDVIKKDSTRYTYNDVPYITNTYTYQHNSTGEVVTDNGWIYSRYLARPIDNMYGFYIKPIKDIVMRSHSGLYKVFRELRYLICCAVQQTNLPAYKYILNVLPKENRKRKEEIKYYKGFKVISKQYKADALYIAPTYVYRHEVTGEEKNDLGHIFDKYLSTKNDEHDKKILSAVTVYI